MFFFLQSSILLRMESPGESVHSAGSDAKSHASKTSISVTLPKEDTKDNILSPVPAAVEQINQNAVAQESESNYYQERPNSQSQRDRENQYETRPLTTTPVNSKEFLAGSNSPSKLMSQGHTERE